MFSDSMPQSGDGGVSKTWVFYFDGGIRIKILGKHTAISESSKIKN